MCAHLSCGLAHIICECPHLTQDRVRAIGPHVLRVSTVVCVCLPPHAALGTAALSSSAPGPTWSTLARALAGRSSARTGPAAPMPFSPRRAGSACSNRPADHPGLQGPLGLLQETLTTALPPPRNLISSWASLPHYRMPFRAPCAHSSAPLSIGLPSDVRLAADHT